MEGRGGAIVDTCVLASKKLRALRALNVKLYVTPVVLHEYFNWALESRSLRLARGDVERAKGYERLIELLPSALAELGMEILEQKFTIAELREVANLILQRSVDPGDALNAITAKKENMSIVTLDEDWQRLLDYVTAVITL